MYTLSQKEDKNGWKLPEGKWLRKGQQGILDEINNRFGNGQLIAQLPTGYGKTLAICLSYAKLKSAGKIDRLLIVVPTREQLDSYADTIEQDFRDIGFHISSAVVASERSAIAMNCSGDAEIFVTTVQALAHDHKNKDLEHFKELMKNSSVARWMVAADEFHHYSEENVWGTAISSLPNVDFVLAVSATPTRTDRKSVFIGGKPDVVVTLKEAVEEDALRRIVVHAQDYFVDISFDGSGEPERFGLTDLEKALMDDERFSNISEAEVRRKVYYHSKYLSKLLRTALDHLNYKNCANPGQHRMIIFALGCAHAKHLVDVINSIEGEKIADWVGSGENGRPDKLNKAIISQFKSGEISVLVQYAIASEGFNCIQASTLVFLNNIGESVLLEQMIGRGLRRNYKIEPCNPGGVALKDFCDIYASFDHPGLEFMMQLETQTKPEDEGVCRGGSGGGKQLRLFPIPDFFVINCEFKSEELYFPLGGEKLLLKDAIKRSREEIPALENASDDEITDRLKQIFGMEPRKASTTEVMDQLKRDIEFALKTFVGNAIRLRSDGSFMPSMIGDMKRATSQRWIALSGTRTKEMTLEQLKEKLQWLQATNAEMIETEQVPNWLRL